ncbi:MAG TPA: hypothetical protein VMB50_01430 [Myxococcales bacterium]|nr:hypothetical protein [Myxococcales bacterium]
MSIDGHLFFHSPCFDGVASAVLAWDVLEAAHGWRDASLHPVDYSVRGRWARTRFPEHSAVVDFLYHPRVECFADHHPTSFLAPEWRRAFRPSVKGFRLFDPAAPSCAGLLWKTYGRFLKSRGIDRAALAAEADRIDAARYATVEEAVFGKGPALVLRSALAAPEGVELSLALVKQLRSKPLAEVAEVRAVRAAARDVERRTAAGLRRLKRAVRLDEAGTAVFDVDGTDVLVSRYGPYLFHPRARYSAGIVRLPGQAKILVMRNPWLDFRGVPLGPIAEAFGGGGHARVAAVDLRGRRARQASAVLAALVAKIERPARPAETARAG